MVPAPTAAGLRADTLCRVRWRKERQFQPNIVRADPDRPIGGKRFRTKFALPNRPAIDEDAERGTVQRGGEAMRRSDLRRLDGRAEEE